MISHKAESLSSACVNSLEFAEMRFILIIPLWDCNNAARMPSLRRRLWHKIVDRDLE